MRIPRDVETDENINITSLLDVIFILVIFLMATMTFKDKERDKRINMPDTDAPQTLSQATQTIVINVLKDGKYVVSGEGKTQGELQKLLAAGVKAHPDQSVLIRGDTEALHGYVAGVVSLCKSAGVQDTRIGYDYKTYRFSGKE